MNKDKAWPKIARWLWKRTKEVLPVLVDAGIEAGRLEDRTGSKITLRKMPENDATNTTEDENREGKPKEGGIKTEDDATANATGRSNAHLISPKKPIAIRVMATAALVATEMGALGTTP